MIDYEVIEAKYMDGDPTSLVGLVKKRLAEGWQLAGGVSCSRYGEAWRYLQAIYKATPDPVTKPPQSEK